MSETDADSTDEDSFSKADAARRIINGTGQGYITARHAHETLCVFGEDVTGGAAEEYADGYKTLVFAQMLADYADMATDARGISKAPAYEPIVTWCDVSEILLLALGEEPDDSTMGGAGFTSDRRHEEQVETLRDHKAFPDLDSDDE